MQKMNAKDECKGWMQGMNAKDECNEGLLSPCYLVERGILSEPS